VGFLPFVTVKAVAFSSSLGGPSARGCNFEGLRMVFSLSSVKEHPKNSFFAFREEIVSIRNF
jgi:hypothetical protein